MCFSYFNRHLAPLGIKIMILSDNPEFHTDLGDKWKDFEGKDFVANGEIYVESLLGEKAKDLLDKLCLIPYNEDEGILVFCF